MRTWNKGQGHVLTSRMLRSLASHRGALTAVAALSTAALMQFDGSPECCGIVGIVSNPKNRGVGARDFLVEGLTVLKNRGYDSAGVATLGPLNGGKTGVLVTKFASVGDKADGVNLVDKASLATELAQVPSNSKHSGEY
jgi:glucosamine--fructose-6-phosphate aminotransferase (isomerizing)